MPDSRAQQVVEVRAALSHALGVAESAFAAARDEFEAAVTRRARVAAAARERRIRLADQRDRPPLRHRHAAGLPAGRRAARREAG
ncbi:hypothetical protein, partial [Actinoplanes sp. NPDC026623]|uniref:hypothetical protein n=1 Tax=Actinoplanes sp. NPDC026623 TaxID=3155610 RepID=UPI0033EC581B